MTGPRGAVALALLGVVIEAGAGAGVARAARMEEPLPSLPGEAPANGAAAGVTGTVIAPTERAATAIRAGLSWLGTPYAWGGGNSRGPTLGTRDGVGSTGAPCRSCMS